MKYKNSIATFKKNGSNFETNEKVYIYVCMYI